MTLQAATDGATEGESESSSGGVLGALTRAVAGSGSNTDASVVSSLVHNILANVVINNTPGKSYMHVCQLWSCVRSLWHMVVGCVLLIICGVYRASVFPIFGFRFIREACAL